MAQKGNFRFLIAGILRFRFGHAFESFVESPQRLVVVLIAIDLDLEENREFTLAFCFDFKRSPEHRRRKIRKVLPAPFLWCKTI